MKKLVSLLLAVCMCLSVGTMLTACDEEHTHTYKTEWTYDTTHHWHECSGEDCVDVSDKAEHVWDEGTITTEATSEADGEKTYTCTVCNATKGESVAFAGVSEEKWNTAIQPSNFDNVTFAFNCSFLEAGISTESFAYNCKIDGNNATMDDVISGQHMTMDAETITTVKDIYINTATAIVENFDNFTYDKDSEAYKSNKDIVYTVTVMGYEATITAKDVSVILDTNSNIASIDCTMIQDFEENGNPKQYTLDITFTYSNYGTTVVE